MRIRGLLGAGLVAGAILVVSAQPGLAKCGDAAGDAAAVQAARVDIAANCNCEDAANHGAYVKCAGQRANFLASDDGGNALPKNCKGAVKKCAAKSTCGKPGAVTCCITKGTKTKCKIAKDSAKCTAKGGTPGGLGHTHSSCCSDSAPLTTDACNASPSGAFLDSASPF
jgi:hypothetical protein